VLFLLAYPVGLTLFTTSTKGYMELNPNYRESLTESYALYLGMNRMTALFVTLLAVISALQGFSYLFKRQKLDLYMSVPVSKGRRFAIIYVNGILLYALPHLLRILLRICIGAGKGVYVGKMIKTIIFSYLGYLIYYMAIYNISIVVVMLTGNLLVALCGVGVFLLYEGGIRLILAAMSSIYFYTYSSYTDEAWYRMAFSPALFFISEFLDSPEGQNVPILLEKFGFILGKTAVIAVIAGIVGYLLYAVRPAENCNKAIVFKKVRPFIKTALLVPLSLVAGILFFSIAGNTAMTVLGFILGLLLCHGILEVIFELDLKAMFKSFASTIAGAVLVFGVYAVFKFDLTGYDKWVPEPEQVESAAIRNYELAFGEGFDLEKGGHAGNEGYMLEHMSITDMESFCTLMESAIEPEDVIKKNDDDQDADGEETIWFTVKYRMKNGKEKYRRLAIPYEENKEELNRLSSGEEYQMGAFQILDEDLYKKASLEQISFNNGMTGQVIEKTDMEEVLQAYKEDLLHFYNIETAAEQYPVGIINFTFYMDTDLVMELYGGNEQVIYYSMPVYENFEKTMAYAEKKRLLEDWKQSVYDIDSVTINSYSERYGEWIDKNFTKQDELEAILTSLVPRGIATFKLLDWDKNNDYSAHVFYKRDEADGNREGDYFSVETDLLPDFAK
ncbi:MAG: hypothetical protein K2K54_12980, partial [Lachnospiraceae bacterium]|nr:hypothetical protein [Lachnospiraceae bacterium]